MMARPASSTGLRPKRSESGPQNSMPAARPMKYAVRVNCPALTVAPSELRERGQRRHEQVGAERGQRHQDAEQQERRRERRVIQDRIRF